MRGCAAVADALPPLAGRAWLAGALCELLIGVEQRARGAPAARALWDAAVGARVTPFDLGAFIVEPGARASRCNAGTPRRARTGTGPARLILRR